MRSQSIASTGNLPSSSKLNHSTATIAGTFQLAQNSLNTGRDTFTGELASRSVRAATQEAVQAPLAPASPEQRRIGFTPPNNLRRVRDVIKRTIHTFRRPRFFAKKTVFKEQTPHTPVQISTNPDAVVLPPRNLRASSSYSSPRMFESPPLQLPSRSTQASPTFLSNRVGKAYRETWQPSGQGSGTRRLLTAKAHLHASCCQSCQHGRLHKQIPSYEQFVLMRRCHTAPARLDVSGSQLRSLETAPQQPVSNEDDDGRKISDTTDNGSMAVKIEARANQPTGSSTSLSLAESATPRSLSPAEPFHPQPMQASSRHSISISTPPRLSSITTVSDSSFMTNDPSGTPLAANSQRLMPPRLQTNLPGDDGLDNNDDENQHTPTEASGHSPASPQDLQWVGGQWPQAESDS
ncbi:MAG: hypothetical protein Q9160_002722 [Pyrenula sp. 1 TL-2023]